MRDAARTRPAKKALGQHFLHERGVVAKIVQAIDPRPGDTVVEIGPGYGAITIPLLHRLGALTAIEFDRDLFTALTGAASAHGQLNIVSADVLTVDLTDLTHTLAPADGHIRLVGNLPYNLSSPILFHALQHAAVIRDMHFMLQKEVVQRMAAAPGGKVYGRLSVMLQAWCTVTALFTVPPGAFRPPPKVESAVVRLVPRAPETIGISNPRRFSDLVRAAFGQRRKTLRNALAGLLAPEQLVTAGIDPGARAEQLAVTDFIRLSALTSDIESRVV